MGERGERRMQPLRRERLYERLAEHITDFIDAQGLVGGDRLPSERELASELGVSRATISRALAALETRGVVEVRHGVGALVRGGAHEQVAGGSIDGAIGGALGGAVGDAGGAAVDGGAGVPGVAGGAGAESDLEPRVGPLDRLDRRPAREAVVAREAMLAGLARAAAADRRAILKSALLASDGQARSFEETWRCIRRLANSPLLADLDETLAASAQAPAPSAALSARLDLIAAAILRADPSAAALACDGLLDIGR